MLLVDAKMIGDGGLFAAYDNIAFLFCEMK